jgi:uncharacterized membrane protein
VSLYEVLKTLHIVAVVIWLGAGFLIALLIARAERSKDRQRQFGYYQDVGWLSPRLFIPASLATLILGILVTAEGDIGFDQAWISIGFAGWAISFLLGILYFKPESQRIAAIAVERGLEDPELHARTARMSKVEWFQLLILFAVIVDMVAKPA